MLLSVVSSLLPFFLSNIRLRSAERIMVGGGLRIGVRLKEDCFEKVGEGERDRRGGGKREGEEGRKRDVDEEEDEGEEEDDDEGDDEEEADGVDGDEADCDDGEEEEEEEEEEDEDVFLDSFDFFDCLFFCFAVCCVSVVGAECSVEDV